MAARGAPAESGAGGAARRGRPRSEASRAAILGAASALLLEHGLNAISMDAVAERAGASKATIYRWWPSKELLALDALFAEWRIEAPAGERDGPLSEDLLALMRPWVAQIGKRNYGRVVAALLSKAQDDEAFGVQYRERFVEPRRAQARAVFERAVARGEIGAEVDLEAALDLLYGPFYHRLLHRHAPLGDAFTRTIVAFVVAAVGGDGAR